MGCQSAVTLGDNLTFGITTHDPDTGILTDADSAPAYRVYEDETAVAILTGTMATLDTANTTGLYSEQIACTAANGFEVDKSYTIYIEATVDSDTGGITYGFTVVSIAAAVWAYATRTLTMAAATAIAALSGSTLSILRGDTYELSLTGLGDISTRTKLWFSVKTDRADHDHAALILVEETEGLIYSNGAAPDATGNGTIAVDDEDDGDITIKIDEVETAKLTPQNNIYYDVQARYADEDVHTLTSGTAHIIADVTRRIE